MQYEVKKAQPLLSEKGTVISVGWSKTPNFVYDKDFCKMSVFKRKERDCYYISNHDVGLYISVAEHGMKAVISAALVIFKEGIIYSNTVTKPFALGNISLPLSSQNGDTSYADNRLGISFSTSAAKRFIKCDFIDFCEGKNLYVHLNLEERFRESDSLNVVIPYSENKRYFFLKRFLPSLRVSGVIRFGGFEFNLEEHNSNAYLDWSRFGVPGKAFYHAIYADGFVNGKNFALCLAGGLGNTSKGNENCFFYNGKIHKLAGIKASGNEEFLDKPWRFQAGTSVLELTFEPMIKKGRLLSTDCDRRSIVFGHISGTINHLDLEPIFIDKIPAHMEFTLL